MTKRAKLYVPLQQRYERGVFPLLVELEDTLTPEQYDMVIRCMNSAFDAGEVELHRELDSRGRLK